MVIPNPFKVALSNNHSQYRHEDLSIRLSEDGKTKEHIKVAFLPWKILDLYLDVNLFLQNKDCSCNKGVFLNFIKGLK